MSDVQWFGDDLLKQIREATPDGLFEAGEMLVKAAASKAPRSSGDLADSGYVTNGKKSTYKAGKKNRKELKPKDGEVIAGFAAFYARFPEYGTVSQPAQPFLRPTLDELKSKMGEEFAVHVKRKIK